MTYLHEDRNSFAQLVIRAGREAGIALPIIEKDYYVTMFLSKLCAKAPDVVFKGGTSLSKGYGVIHRFSEDIDLNYDNNGNKPSVSMRRTMKDAILSAGEQLGLELLEADPERIPYKQDFLTYQFAYPALFSDRSLKQTIQIETSVRSPSFPVEVRRIDSEIQKYLGKIGDENSIEEYDLKPFTMKTQSLKRTFADKLYAVADYCLKDMADRDSRHLYDLYCMRRYVPLNEDFWKFISEIREIRRTQPNNPAAQSDRSVLDILQDAADTDFYKTDYEKYTLPLLFENVPYENVKRNLQEVVMKLKVFQD